jgi:hypothetical protein
MGMIGMRAYARHRGCTLRAVQKAIGDGRITATKRGRSVLIDPAKADTEWVANTDPSQVGVHDDSASGFQAARTKQLRVRIAREELELQRARREIIGLEEAKRLAFTSFRTMRDALMNVAGRVKDQCAAESDPFAIERLIDDEIARALGKFDAAKVLRDTDEDDE